MITAVDSSVLFDILTADARFGPSARRAVGDSLRAGRLVACEIVWAEVGSYFADPAQAADALDRLGLEFEPLTQAESLLAGQAWADYRRRGGTRQRVVADFLIGAHARTRTDRLLTRDRGFFRAYFAGLQVMDPTAPDA